MFEVYYDWQSTVPSLSLKDAFHYILESAGAYVRPMGILYFPLGVKKVEL